MGRVDGVTRDFAEDFPPGDQPPDSTAVDGQDRLLALRLQQGGPGPRPHAPGGAARLPLRPAAPRAPGLSLWITILGKRRQWHRHWLEDRELAERLRRPRVQILVGASGGADRPLAPERIPTSEAASGEPDWITWIPREEEIDSQIGYHRANHGRSHRLEHGLHGLGAVLFFSTLGICGLFALLYFPVLDHLDHLDHPDRSSDAYDVIAKIVTLVTALFPAFAGIHAQSDLGTLVRRSWETKTRLERLAASMDGQKTHSLAALSERVTMASEILVSDLDSWRTIFVARPLVLPS
ncbi:MAG: hypothetical protein K9H25_09360 [Rhodospirillum sp.]|nr:hypothetical protein [Rhodospirillum sp.]MCF8490703.1 hypothetical protein [Rhodospirillum sp.]MCF8499398.1 hypothetical protein [Rhodospirillum sp.]